jgi:type 1 fimbriae regulatory protein FimB/type 1 fimbriae regulatory protein FimE
VLVGPPVLTFAPICHACGYRLANKGKDTGALQGYLSHADIGHTAEYSMLAPNRLRTSARTEEGALKPGKPAAPLEPYGPPRKLTYTPA